MKRSIYFNNLMWLIAEAEIALDDAVEELRKLYFDLGQETPPEMRLEEVQALIAAEKAGRKEIYDEQKREREREFRGD